MDEQIKKYFQEELNIAERLDLLKGVEADSELKQQFIEYKNMHALFALSDPADNKEESRQGYLRFTQNIRSRKIRRFTLQTVGYAATIALLIASTYWFTANTFGKQTYADVMNTLHVPAGQRVKLTLQDGTDVWLNAQSTLTYPALFSDNERRVTIEGEAFFDVAKDAQKPFIVSSQGVEMKVLGTRFNVDSYPGSDRIQTSLVEGSLQIYAPLSRSGVVILKPDEMVTIQGHKMKVTAIPHSDHFLWKEGVYSFKNELLIDILKKLELYYDVKIVVQDPSIFKWEYTGKFRQRDGIDKILQMIQHIHKFTVRKDEKNNIITLSK